MIGDARSEIGDSHLMIGDAQPHHVNLPLQSTDEFNHGESTNLVTMSVECPDCGDTHRRLSMLPDHPISISTLESLTESNSILYTGPTLLRSDGTTPMIVITTPNKANVVSYYEDEGWLVTSETERDDIDEEFGQLVNEMASQCIEAGYQCVEQWHEDGEPGASVPK